MKFFKILLVSLACFMASLSIKAQGINSVTVSPNPAYTTSFVTTTIQYYLSNGCWSFTNYSSYWSGTTLNVYANFNNSNAPICPSIYSTGSFTISLGNLSANNYTIKVWDYDTNSLLFTQLFTVIAADGCYLPANYTTSVTNITSNSAKLNLNNVSGYASYEWHYKPNNSSSWTTASSTTNTITITGLASSTLYNWQVRVKCTNGTWSNWINGLNFTTLSNVSCTAPTGLSTSNITQNTATFTWGTVSGATYIVQFYNGTWSNLGGAISGNTMNVYGLWANSTYQWRVVAICSNGQQNTSSTVTFSTPYVTNCTGGAQYPTNSLTPASSWQYQPNVWGGKYCVVNVQAGVTYTFSYCSINGALLNFDGQLSLRTTSDQLIAFSDDYCGIAPKIIWTSNFTGQIRLLLSKYSCSTQNTNSTLAYRIGNFPLSEEASDRESDPAIIAYPTAPMYLDEIQDEIIATAPKITSSTTTLQISPNPTSGYVSLQSEKLLQRLRVLDAMGRVVKDMEGNIQELDFTTLPNGIYFLKVKYEDQETEDSYRLIKN
ncbi:MAG: T9SS type A sorting domain-containing protein [Bacteroidota bacterium]